MSSMIKRKSEEAFFKPKREFKRRGPNGFPIGARTKRRQKENRELNKLPAEIKNHCELRIDRICVGNKMLTWAHSRKSRFIVTKALWQEAARACLPCHQYAEDKGHREMHRLVTEAIARRKVPAPNR